MLLCTLRHPSPPQPARTHNHHTLQLLMRGDYLISRWLLVALYFSLKCQKAPQLCCRSKHTHTSPGLVEVRCGSQVAPLNTHTAPDYAQQNAIPTLLKYPPIKHFSGKARFSMTTRPQTKHFCLHSSPHGGGRSGYKRAYRGGEVSKGAET